MLSGPGPSLRIGAIIGVVVFFIIHFTNAGKCLFSHYSFLPIIFHLLDVPIMKSIQALDFENKVLIEKNIDIEIPIFIRIPTVNFAVTFLIVIVFIYLLSECCMLARGCSVLGFLGPEPALAVSRRDIQKRISRLSTSIGYDYEALAIPKDSLEN